MSGPASIYNQYLTAYKHNAATYGPNTGILMLVGGFYELYDVIDEGEPQTSMKRAVEILGIQLKLKKGDAGGKDGLFAGFPKDSLMKYVALLTRENWTVAVLDQVDTGKQRKDRTLARIYSPGTTDPTGNDAVFLGGVWFTETNGPPTFSAAAVDLTTGCSVTYAGKAAGKQESWTTDDLVHFFQVHPPKELIFWWSGAPIAMPSDLVARKAVGSSDTLLHRRQAKASTPLESEELARKAFGGSLLQHVVPPVMISLLKFINDHYMSAVSALHPPTAWCPETAVFLGNHALTQLNMIAPRTEDSVLGLFLRTATPFGRRAMRERLLYPICDPVALETRYKQVDWALKTDIVPILRQIEDLPRLHQKIRTGFVSAADVLLLDKSYERTAALAAVAGTSLGPVPDMTEYLAAFHSIFSIEKAKVASEDAFCLQDDVAPAVTALERRLVETRSEIDKALESATHALGLTPGSLRLDYKEASVVITGTKAVMALAAKEAAKAKATLTLRKTSSSMEIPAITTLYHTILGLRDKLQAAIRAELPPLCDRLAFASTWIAVENWVANADITATMATVALNNGFCRPRLGEGLEITGLAHPLIESQQTKVEYIRHSVSLNDRTNGWLVYGMNASGKSSLMKAVGIATLLAQAGSYVPATTFQFKPFRSLFTRILNKDDIWAGLSSFAVEMTELNEILRRADHTSLVLGDEVCSGTESDSATALVGAALAWMTERRVRFIFATHLHGLHSLPEVKVLDSVKVWHLRVRRELDRLIYERTLQPGPGSSLYGLEVAKAMGLPLAFLERAHSIRKEIAGVDGVSQWNPAVKKTACEICASEIGLEVHHVRQRSEAVNGRLPDGSDMNSARNLAVLCGACHDAHHAGSIEVGSVQQTSEGPERVFKGHVNNVQKAPEDDGDIESSLRAAPNAPLKRIQYDLEMKGITVSIQRLRGIRQKIQ